MPFDPALPTDGSALQSAVIRGQFTGLAEMIAALLPAVTAEVDDVTTLPAGSPVEVTVNFSAATLHFTFAIPQGAEGPAGPTGPDGAPGPAGPQGPPFASAVVDSVTTLDPGQSATVGVSFDGTNVHFTFGIPRGVPGEVTQAALDTAIAGTARNPNTVAPLSLTADGSYNPAQIQSIADKLDELLAAAMR